MHTVSYFKDLLSEEEIILDGSRLETFNIDWRGRYRSHCQYALRPTSVESVQKILRVAFDKHLAVTPQGGNTSMCGASIPSVNNSVIVVMEGLSRLRSFNVLDKSVTVEAGMILENLQSLVAEQGFCFPLSLASEGSCQIGGNIACNAGGLNVLRYGTMRDLVLGLEVVLPNGELVSHLSSLHKNTTGLDSKQLWIGSEGTLGIITAATLKIFACATEKITLLIACVSLTEVLLLLKELQFTYMHELTSFEYMSQTVFELSQQFSGISFNLTGEHMVLCELSLQRDDYFDTGALFQHLLSLGFVNTIIASSKQEAKTMWRVRENISEAQKNQIGVSIKHDIAVPISALADFIESTESKLKTQFPDAIVLLFGHFGDGSLHYNVALKRDTGQGVYRFEEAINQLVYNEVLGFSGTVAAEHGIGQLKSQWLSSVKNPQEIVLMQNIKQHLDPKNIMNPGKILPK